LKCDSRFVGVSSSSCFLASLLSAIVAAMRDDALISSPMQSEVFLAGEEKGLATAPGA
jgi:hypothetical protein